MKEPLYESLRVPRRAALLIVLLGFLASSTEAQAAGIQMLPPTDFSGNPCAGATSGLLQWDGSTTIKCVPGTAGTGNGYVGIGTTSPQALLQIGPKLTFTSGSSPYDSMDITYNAFAGSSGWQMMSDGYATSISMTNTRPDLIPGSIAFYTAPFMTQGTSFNGGVFTPKMIISNAGNVGIGTTNPMESLQITSTADGPPQFLLDNATDARLAAYAHIGGYGAIEAEGLNYENKLPLVLNPWGGNVGVGTTEPADQLDVYSSLSTPSGIDQVVIEGETGVNNGGFLRLQGNWPVLRWGSNVAPSGSKNFQIQNSGPGYLILGSNNDDWSWKKMGIMTWTSSGNVGIGNTNPSYILDVTGQARFTGNYTTSDRRLKTNIVDVGYGLADVMKLHPVFFDWKKPVKGEEGRRVGFIAQEVEQVIPEVVSTAPDAMKTKGVEYGNVTPVLVKAVQQIKALFDTDHDALMVDHEALARLKVDNDNEAAQIKTLTARLDGLEAKTKQQ